MNYKEIVKNVLNNGREKSATRSGISVENKTIGTFLEVFRHDMSRGFPLTTLRKMPWLNIRVELEGFIKGITDKRWYQERGCKYWDQWSNPQSKNDYDLGPIYGFQWRNFGGKYLSDRPQDEKVRYQTGRDQLADIVSKLKNSPYDRRMVCSAWNPTYIKSMALPPCHWAFNVVVYEDKLNLAWHQRSADVALGVPSNIASYALLMLLLCEESGLEPGELVGTFADCHIYENHIDTCRQLVEREELDLPTLSIQRKDSGDFSIFDWTHKEVELQNYNCHDKLNMGAVTV